MTDTQLTPVLAAPIVTLAELRAQVDEARANMIEAWKSQSVTTVAEGYTYEQAEAAHWHALIAEAHYTGLYNCLEARLAEMIRQTPVIDEMLEGDELAGLPQAQDQDEESDLTEQVLGTLYN